MMHFDRVLAESLWDWARHDADPNARGQWFEFLVGYLLLTLFDYAPRFRLRQLDGETDILFERGGHWHGLHSEFGNYMLAECKNTDARVDASIVKKFGASVRYAGCRAGILASVAGFTGGEGGEARYALYTARKLYHRDGVVLLLLDGPAVESVATGAADFPAVLRSAYEGIRFDLRL